MEHLQHTPLRWSILPAAIVATVGLAAMLTTMLILVLLATSLSPVRRRRSIAALASPTATADFRRDEDSMSSSEELSAGMGNECCICLEQPSADGIASISGCGHTFCAECIIRWAGTRNVCPLCRTLFTSIELADGALQQVSGRRLAAADLDFTPILALARLLRLRREDVQTVEYLSEVLLRSIHEYVAYWSVIAAAITNTLNELNERKNQLERRLREVRERNREVREKNDQTKQMNDEVKERNDDLERLMYLRLLGLNEVHSDDSWLRNEVQQLGNRVQQVSNESDSISDELDQIEDEVDQIKYEMDQINDEMGQIRDETC